MSELDVVKLFELIRTARIRNASDVHLGGGERPALRIDGRLTVLDHAPVSERAVNELLAGMLPTSALTRLAERGTAAGAQRHPEIGSFRLHAYRQLSGTRVVIRLLSKTIPNLELLALPGVVGDLALRPSGLLLFTGPTGSGKTTALAALIDRINRTVERNVITVEDPVEYIHTPLRSLVTHCEVGRDVIDYGEAIRGFLRADPDVVLIGEMRDRETMEAAMTAAETGLGPLDPPHQRCATDRRSHRRFVSRRVSKSSSLTTCCRLDRRRLSSARPKSERAGAAGSGGNSGCNRRRTRDDSRRKDAPVAKCDHDRAECRHADPRVASLRTRRSRLDRS